MGLIVAFTGDNIKAFLILLLVACVMTRDGTKFDPPAFRLMTIDQSSFAVWTGQVRVGRTVIADEAGRATQSRRQ